MSWKKEVSPEAVYWDVTDLVDDKQFGLQIEFELVFQVVFVVGPGKAGDQGLGADKQGAVTAADGLDAESHRQVGS